MAIKDEKLETSLKLNPVEEMIKRKAVLAPMSGVSDAPFRIMARKFGCAFAFTEMIDVNAITHNSRKSFQMIDRFPQDDPLGVQLVGEDEEKLLYVAKLCEEKGFPIIDINAGCPARKVVKGGKGSALLKDPAKLGRIVNRLVKELTVPVSVKIRSGWDEDSLNYLEVAKVLEAEGASAICIHARTKEKMYKGKADHEITKEVRKAVNIPVFASGNLFKASDVSEVLAATGCSGAFIARGALGRPWIFSEINNYFFDAPYSEPSFSEIKKIIVEHFLLCLDFYDVKITFKKMYKHLAWYLKGLKNLDLVMRKYHTLEDAGSFQKFMKRLKLDKKKYLKA